MLLGAFVQVARWLDGLPVGNEDLGVPQDNGPRPSSPQGSGGKSHIPKYFDASIPPHGRYVDEPPQRAVPFRYYERAVTRR